MALAVCVIGIIAEIITWKVAVRTLGLPSFTLRDADSDTRKMLFGFGLFTVAANSAQQLSRNSSSIIGGIVAGPSAVAYYSVAESITQKLQTLGKPIGQAAMPAASQLLAEDRRNKLSELTEQTMRILLALALVFTCVIWVFGFDFVKQWISLEFAQKSYPMFCILTLALAATLPGSSMMQMLQGLGQVRFTAQLALCEGISVVVLGIPMTLFFGMLGMAITLLATSLFFQGAIQGIHLLKIVGLSIRELVVHCFVPAVCAFIPTLLFAVTIRRLSSPTNLLEVLLEMAATLVVSAVAIFLICLPVQTRKETFSALVGSYLMKRVFFYLRKS